jgi:hypothetical protein
VTPARQRLTGRIHLALPPDEAFHLFTPRGEQRWAPGWRPYFPAPTEDDTEPGTVFETDAHGHHTTWLVLDRQPGQRIHYARVTPGDRAGTVTVTLRPTDHGTEAEVTYHLTALTTEAADELAAFAHDYPAYLRSWQDAISSAPTARAGSAVSGTPTPSAAPAAADPTAPHPTA